MGSQHVNQLPVLERGRIVGMLRREDLINWLVLHETTEDELQLREA
jgi:predicted transcriptional regulator